MKTRIYANVCLATLCLILCTANIQAQVSVGMETVPARAALLDLKTQEVVNPPGANDDANVTSTWGGLLLPRVELKDTMTLEPFIPVTDPDWVNQATSRIKELHAGLMAYNLTDNAFFKPGFYSWNGRRWIRAGASSLTAGNGLSQTSGAFLLGGTLTKPTTINHDQYSFSLSGSGAVDVETPVLLSGPLAYKYGQPGNGKVLTSDASGTASWQNNVSIPHITPTAVFSSSGSSLPFASYANTWVNTDTYISLPPGRWMIMVTMLVRVGNVTNSDRYWLESTFVKEGEQAPNPTDYIGSNQSISGSLNGGYNIISGYVVLENKSSDSVKFYYCVGQGKRLGGSTNAVLDQIGSDAWAENSIVAFSLVE
ncbi:MAG: hypothetical protein LBC40_06835 [Dysgonamonadaceae bacterium]|nr:hypothetical protein [Dysgonamonadaceae bacterium]